MFFSLKDVYFRASQLGFDSLAKKARQTAQQIAPRDQMTSDQLKLLNLLDLSSESGHPETGMPRLLGDWDEGDSQLHRLEGGERSLADRLAAMKFETSNGKL